jgi:cytoskeletal protein RodZ
MQPDFNALSFGRYLRALRATQHISLLSVAQETRIGVEQLRLIEKEDHDRLPPEVFVIGFLRSYAAVLGADGDEVIRRYRASLNEYRQAIQSEADFKVLNKRFWPRLLFAVGVYVMVVAVGLTGLHLHGRSWPESDHTPDVSAPAPAEAGRSQRAETTAVVEPAEAAKVATPDVQHLKIAAHEEVWLRITIDDRQPRELRLKAGDQLELEARQGFRIIIGNAGGVKLVLNDKPWPISEVSGQVVQLQLP